jgi:cytochrome c peroxidase
MAGGCSGGGGNSTGAANARLAGTPGAEQGVGERLFLETRFAQAFKVFLDDGGALNDPRADDPVVRQVETTGLPITPGPFNGKSMNCRSCHMVDDVLAAPGGGMRAYADFTVRSPIPARADGKTHAPRNSPSLVNSALDRLGGVLFHFDAEFNSMEALVAATLTGRNYGWLPGERAQAVAHIARVVRGDDGSDDLAQDFGGVSYRILFTGTNPAIPEELRLPPEFRVFVGSGTDQEIFDAVVKAITAYVNGLLFSQTDDTGRLIRSPFDVFLEINGLPQQPDANESPLDYSRRLRTLVHALASPQFVTANPNNPAGFQFHSQNFEFGAAELEGLKMFLAEPAALPASGGELAAGKIGNCVACHAAPSFTDFKLHNTGTTQMEYDGIHGAGQFAALPIPALGARDLAYDQYLPATELHPMALEPFRAIPNAGTPGHTDLGVWNVFGNPDIPGPQAKIRAILCDGQAPCPADDALLERTVAAFKTPGLRDLGHSAPYMHNGQFGTIDSVIQLYRDTSDAARGGSLRNGAAQLQGIALTVGDIPFVAAFLRALNEDYQ